MKVEFQAEYHRASQKNLPQEKCLKNATMENKNASMKN